MPGSLGKSATLFGSFTPKIFEAVHDRHEAAAGQLDVGQAFFDGQAFFGTDV